MKAEIGKEIKMNVIDGRQKTEDRRKFSVAVSSESPERAQDNSPGQRPGIRCNVNFVAPRSTIEKGDTIAWGKIKNVEDW